MDFIDLFCGAGLFSEGFVQAGHKPIWACDNWKVAAKSYEANHKIKVDQRDIMTISPGEIPRVDLIIGSPPCPTFSDLRHDLKKNDPILVNKFIEIINFVKPKFWIMENVPGVLPFIPGNWIKKTLSASNFGANQLRKRVFVGHFIPPFVQRIKKHKIHSMTGSLERFSLNPNTKWEMIKKFQKYFNGKRPTEEMIKSEMGLRQDYILFGSKSDKFKMLGNGVYVPIAFELGKMIK